MKIHSVILLLSAISQANAFSPVTPLVSRTGVPKAQALNMKEDEVASFDPLHLSTENNQNDIIKSASLAASLGLLLTVAPEHASAAGPDWGIFEGRTLSLLHPAIMGGTFLFSLSTALKGFQYRRQRTIGDEIKEVKKSLPALGGASSVQAALSTAESAEEVDTALVNKLKAALPIQIQVDSLTQERKDLTKMGLRDKHFSQGALLAFIGTSFAIEVRK
jgi:hypothetical protein